MFVRSIETLTLTQRVEGKRASMLGEGRYVGQGGDEENKGNNEYKETWECEYCFHSSFPLFSLFPLFSFFDSHCLAYTPTSILASTHPPALSWVEIVLGTKN